MDFKKVSELISKNAAAYPDKIYAYYKGRTYTYAQMEESITRTARVLAAHGLKKGDRCGILLGNSPEFLFAYFAMAKMGVIAVPMNNFLKEMEIAQIMNDCEAKYLVSGSLYQKVVVPLKDMIPTLEKIFSFEDTDFNATNIYTQEASEDINVEADIQPDDVAVLIYTSGTTGQPKGVMLTNRNLVHNAYMYKMMFAPFHEDRVVTALPMYHSYAFTCCVLGSLSVGASIIILDSIQEVLKTEFLELVKELKPSTIMGVPQLYSSWARKKLSPEEKEALSFRLYICGGAPMPEDTLKIFKESFGKPILEGYGLSEASPIVTFNPLDRQKYASVGTVPPELLQVKIVDENDNELGVNEPGEIILKGDNIMLGYWNQPEETARAMRNGWFHTGDVGRIDEDGFLFLVDRIKDLIIVKGMNVYPREIEELLHHHPAVHAASVIGVPDRDGSEKIVAYVIPNPEVTVTENELKTYIKQNMANFKVPRSIIFTDDIPVTASGKILKRELRDKVLREMQETQ